VTEPSRPRDTRIRDRALFITIGLFVVLGAYAGHQYFGSDAGRARSIVQEARSRPTSAALVQLGCRDPKVFTPAEVAQLVHLGKLPGVTPLHGVHLALCVERGGASPRCDAVGDAYVAAGGQLPVHVLVLRDGRVTCSVLRVAPPSQRVDVVGAASG
jgi:hypothetical protein